MPARPAPSAAANLSWTSAAGRAPGARPGLHARGGAATAPHARLQPHHRARVQQSRPEVSALAAGTARQHTSPPGKARTHPDVLNRRHTAHARSWRPLGSSESGAAAKGDDRVAAGWRGAPAHAAGQAAGAGARGGHAARAHRQRGPLGAAAAARRRGRAAQLGQLMSCAVAPGLASGCGAACAPGRVATIWTVQRHHGARPPGPRIETHGT